MTEYEMAYLLNELNTSAAVYASTAFTTVTGFLVAGYLVAHRLSRLMLSIFIFLYAVWYWGAVSRMLFTLSNIAGLASKMGLFAAQGKGLEWHNVSSWTSNYSYWATATSIATALFMAAVFAASVIFFFHCRRVNRKAELALRHPRPDEPAGL